MKKHLGSLVALSVTIICISIWNYIFYYIENNPVNLMWDIPYTLLIFSAAWWLGTYYDRSKVLIVELDKSKKQYAELLNETHLVLNNIQDTVFQTDAEGKFTYLNPAWYAFTGFTVEESLSTSFYYYVKMDEKKAIRKYVSQQISAKKEDFSFEVRYRKKDGGDFWGEVRCRLYYHNDGSIRGSVGTIINITERKTAEEELFEINRDLAMQSQKLAIAGQLAAGIAHEVRNPLTSVNGFLQLMRSENPAHEQYFDIIFSEIKRIDLVLSEMLVLAKPQSIQFRAHDLHLILQSVLTLLQSNANMYNIILEKNLHALNSLISCDENQLKQVFINLVKNAIEAMPTGGTLRLKTENSGSNIVVSIIDQGVGMTDKQLAQLGEPFFTTKETGTGLGLTVCLRILRDHSGDIDVRSELGKGTTFNITLPVSPKPPSSVK
ncbi:PAS domain S-box protein [Bacillus lacus]|uniref:histidine kinase n=1 Tax=Metabacillus lacus TaxID=1983721 RepID=A0A7X2IXV1_9BACI|nr:ATP-binding protein [Metabacillus lacus]MRX71650.1 PAS domain S-box protein [Metabacillus lacus]